MTSLPSPLPLLKLLDRDFKNHDSHFKIQLYTVVSFSRARTSRPRRTMWAKYPENELVRAVLE